MKILFVGRNCKVGGGSTFRYRASKGLLARGHEIHLAAQGGPLAPRFEALGVKFHRVWPTPFNRMQLAWLLNREKFDLVHTVTPTAGDDLVAVLPRVKSANRPKFVLSIHGALGEVAESVDVNPCLAQAQEVICFDAGALKRLRRIRGVETRPIHQLNRPVEARDDLAGPSGAQPKIVMVSRLSKSKGQAALCLFEAIPNLLAQFPDLRVEVVGGGSLLPRVQEKAKALEGQLKSPIVVHGALDDPLPVMKTADLLVGTAYAALEALFHGVPVLASGFAHYGMVREENLQHADDCNFGDTIPDRVAPEPVRFERELREALVHYLSPEGQAEMTRIQAKVREAHSIERLTNDLERIYGASA